MYTFVQCQFGGGGGCISSDDMSISTDWETGLELKVIIRMVIKTKHSKVYKIKKDYANDLYKYKTRF